MAEELYRLGTGPTDGIAPIARRGRCLYYFPYTKKNPKNPAKKITSFFSGKTLLHD